MGRMALIDDTAADDPGGLVRTEAAPSGTVGGEPERRAAPPLGRDFLIVWVGQALSAIGSMLSGVGISVWAFLETGSAAWLGVLIAVGAAPSIVLMPVMGVVDRLPRRRVMILADLVSALAASALLALASADRLEMWHLAIIAAVSGSGAAFQAPAFQAAIPELVEPEALGRANGLNQFGPALGITIGPLLAAPLVGWWGIAAVAAVDLITFLVAVTTVLAVRFGPSPDRSAPTQTDASAPSSDDAVDAGDWSAAFAWLRGPGRALVTLLLTMAVVNFVLSAFNVSILALAVDVGGTGGAGVPLAMGGVAMIAGSIVGGARGVPQRRIRAVAVALAAFGVGTVIAALRPSLAVLTIGVVIALASVPMVNAAMATIFHERVPGSMQGRVFAIRGALGQSLGPAGSLSMGAFIALVAQPAMDGGWASGSLGAVIGTGPERGPAMALVACGVALLALAARLGSSWINGALDGDRA